MGKAQRNGGARIKVMIVDDHPIVRQGLAQLIDQETDMAVCGEADDRMEALKVAAAEQPNIIIADLTLKDSGGIELIKDLKVRCPGTPVLVLSMHEESLYAERALRAGARGYLMKDRAGDEIVGAVRQVVGGQVYLSDRMATTILRKLVGSPRGQFESPIDQLSDREFEVFQLIGRGKATREIAANLHLSVKTIETYREHIKEKLRLQNAAQLMQHAIEWTQSERA